MPCKAFNHKGHEGPRRKASFVCSPRTLYNRKLARISDRGTIMKMKSVLFVVLVCSFAVGQVPEKPSTQQETPISARARQIHNSALIIDTHADTPQRFVDEAYDIGSTDPKDVGHISREKARAGNLDAEFFSIGADPETNQGNFAKRTFDLIERAFREAAHHPDRMMMAFSTTDIERAHREHKLAACMGIEGGHSIENDIRLLRDYYRLGVRYMTLSWSNTNEFADSSDRKS